MQAAGERLGEHVAGQPPLGVARDAHAHELQRDDGHRLAQDEALEVAELGAADADEPGLRGNPAARLDRQDQAAAAEQRLGIVARPQPERCVERLAAGRRRLALRALPGDRVATGIEDARVAADRLGDDAHDGVQPALLEHEPLETVLDLRAPPQRLVLLVDEVRRGTLGDCDERQLVGHLEQRQRPPPRRVDDRRRQRGVRQPGPDAERRDPVVDEPVDELALAGAGVELDAGRQQQLAAAQPRRRVQQLGRVHPADRRARARLGLEQAQAELAGQGGDRQHPAAARSDAAVSTDRRIACISSNCGGPQMSGGASWMTGSPRSSVRQIRPWR